MPEHDNDKHDNDKLENFFQKATSRPEISFHEADWEKLEARLDAEGVDAAAMGKPWYKRTGAMVLTVLFLISGVYWGVNQRLLDEPEVAARNAAEKTGDLPRDTPDDESISAEPPSVVQRSNEPVIPGQNNAHPKKQAPADTRNLPLLKGPISTNDRGDDGLKEASVSESDYGADKTAPFYQPLQDEMNDGKKFQGFIGARQQGIVTLDNKQVYHQLIHTSAITTDKIRQRADVMLSGAEKAGIPEGAAIIKEEHASDEKKYGSVPRVSLLLSLAPDFSGTAMRDYTDPGKAYGFMVHYHIGNAWRVSGGIISNKKRYTGDGEDYQPPKGYWKNYTNGVIPNSIDGSCSILEFPIMVQYEIAQTPKGKFLIGAGASSYTMLSESYRYNFEAPNPGAKEGWDSRQSSRFTFNMLNFTIGYERQIVSGLMIGIEPYMKIPIEAIGWSNVRLFSTGASLTLRYNLLKKKYSSMPIRSRGPD